MAASSPTMSDHLGMFALLWLDLVLEILYRLPVKSLLTLKCVCKPLNSITSYPNFAKDHLRLSRTCHYHLVLCQMRYFSETDFIHFDYLLPTVFDNSTASTTIIPETILEFPLNPSKNRSVIFGSCNGIICFKTIDNNNNHVDLVVWNPCIRKFKILPPLENLPKATYKSGHYNIGYDGFSDNYKVVAVTYQQFNRSNFFSKTLFRVHTLGTNFWKTIPGFPSKSMGEPYQPQGVFVCDTINWVIRPYQKNGHSWVILSLNLGSESYNEISQPDYGLDKPLCNLNLEVSRNCLYVLAHTKTFIETWVMKDYGKKDSWTKLFTVPFVKFVGYRDPVNMLCIGEEDDQVWLAIDLKVYLYNYKNGTIKSLNIQGLPSKSFDFNLSISNVYIESLVSP